MCARNNKAIWIFFRYPLFWFIMIFFCIFHIRNIKKFVFIYALRKGDKLTLTIRSKVNRFGKDGALIYLYVKVRSCQFNFTASALVKSRTVNK